MQCRGLRKCEANCLGICGTQNLNAKMDANSILTHAFKGMTMGTPPLGSPPVYSPRLGRRISSSGERLAVLYTQSEEFRALMSMTGSCVGAQISRS